MHHAKRRKASLVVALAVTAMSLGGCVVAARPAYVVEGPVVRVAPPPDRYEVVGVAPTPGYVWFGGYWEWVGGRHVWREGHGVRVDRVIAGSLTIGSRDRTADTTWCPGTGSARLTAS